MNSRRLRKEIEYHTLREDGDEDVDYFLTNTTDSEFYFVLFVNENKIYNIKIIFEKSYPFRVPKVMIIKENGEEIGNYLNSLQSIRVLNDRNEPICLCCESLVCHGRWYTTCNTLYIMSEIRKNYNTLNNNVIDACCNSIIRQRLKKNAQPFLEYKLIQKFLY